MVAGAFEWLVMSEQLRVNDVLHHLNLNEGVHLSAPPALLVGANRNNEQSIPPTASTDLLTASYAQETVPVPYRF